MADTMQSVQDLPDVSFIDDDTIDQMRTRLVANYESEYKRITGEDVSLSLSDPNRIMLYACALSLYQVEQYVDRAGKQDLLKYSYGKFLDNLAAARGVIRVQPQPAKTTLRFTLSETKSYAVGIPQGTMVTNGSMYFATDEYGEVAKGSSYVDINATCTENGIEGNDLLEGQINTMVSLIPYVASAVNITASSGACDLEDDESLAERVFLSPSSYSVAGPDDAYIYWTKTYSSSIGDVNVSSDSPAEVQIRILMADGTLPTSTILKEVADYLESSKMRPLTDKVYVKAPDVTKFDIDFTYYINSSDQSKTSSIQSLVAAAVSEYIDWQTNTIGRDINPSELTKRLMQAGAKRVEIAKPVFTKIADTSVARVSTQTATYGGLEND